MQLAQIALYTVTPYIKVFRVLTTMREEPLENIVGKGENAGYQHFLLVPQCFLALKR